MKEMRSPYELDNFQLSAIASQLRLKVFEICKKAKSGHIGASSAAVELFTALYFGGILKYDASDPQHSDRDRVLVRGHLGPLRYAIFSLLGWIENEELESYRRLGSRLQGHENHLETPGVDITPSGSLGMLLSYGVGCAISALNQGKDYKTYVFLGDGEEQEGNVSEAARHAAHLKLPNLIAVIDRNHKQLSDPTVVCDSSDLAAVWRGYGWRVIHLMDGNDIVATSRAFHSVLSEMKDGEKPIVLIANTSKGLGLPGAKEHFSGYHTIGVCPNGVVDEAIRTAKENRHISSQFEISSFGDNMRTCTFSASISSDDPRYCSTLKHLEQSRFLPGGLFPWPGRESEEWHFQKQSNLLPHCRCHSARPSQWVGFGKILSLSQCWDSRAAYDRNGTWDLR